MDQLVFDVASFYNVELDEAAEILARLTADEIEFVRGDVERTMRR